MTEYEAAQVRGRAGQTLAAAGLDVAAAVRVLAPNVLGLQVCRTCGCTDITACDDFWCWWIEEDLCSSCAEEPVNPWDDHDEQKLGAIARDVCSSCGRLADANSWSYARMCRDCIDAVVTVSRWRGRCVDRLAAHLVRLASAWYRWQRARGVR